MFQIQITRQGVASPQEGLARTLPMALLASRAVAECLRVERTCKVDRRVVHVAGVFECLDDLMCHQLVTSVIRAIGLIPVIYRNTLYNGYLCDCHNIYSQLHAVLMTP